MKNYKGTPTVPDNVKQALIVGYDIAGTGDTLIEDAYMSAFYGKFSPEDIKKAEKRVQKSMGPFKRHIDFIMF